MEFSKKEVLQVLNMPKQQFEAEMIPLTRKENTKQLGDTLQVRAMLGHTNICKNNCLYCGMRASNKDIKRYRLPVEDILASVNMAADNDFGHFFMIGGEDLGFGFDNVLKVVNAAKERGMFVSLACGEYTAEQYKLLKAAGCDEYVCKFEMSDPDTFDRLNPSTTFKKRMQAIYDIQNSGMLLASGNIVGYPGQTLDMLADDIMLMKELNISWSPTIPYMPAKGTPLAAEGGRGDLLLNLKQIALVRLMIPGVNYTAQQPGENPQNGLADLQGNLDAIDAGANVLFCDLLPETLAQNFKVIDRRNVTGTKHIFELEKHTGKTIVY